MIFYMCVCVRVCVYVHMGFISHYTVPKIRDYPAQMCSDKSKLYNIKLSSFIIKQHFVCMHVAAFPNKLGILLNPHESRIHI